MLRIGVSHVQVILKGDAAVLDIELVVVDPGGVQATSERVELQSTASLVEIRLVYEGVRAIILCGDQSGHV